jgi:hypothetical protein
MVLCSVAYALLWHRANRRWRVQEAHRIERVLATSDSLRRESGMGTKKHEGNT